MTKANNIQSRRRSGGITTSKKTDAQKQRDVVDRIATLWNHPTDSVFLANSGRKVDEAWWKVRATLPGEFYLDNKGKVHGIIDQDLVEKFTLNGAFCNLQSYVDYMAQQNYIWEQYGFKNVNVPKYKGTKKSEVEPRVKPEKLTHALFTEAGRDPKGELFTYYADVYPEFSVEQIDALVKAQIDGVKRTKVDNQVSEIIPMSLLDSLSEGFELLDPGSQRVWEQSVAWENSQMYHYALGKLPEYTGNVLETLPKRTWHDTYKGYTKLQIDSEAKGGAKNRQSLGGIKLYHRTLGVIKAYNIIQDAEGNTVVTCKVPSGHGEELEWLNSTVLLNDLFVLNKETDELYHISEYLDKEVSVPYNNGSNTDFFTGAEAVSIDTQNEIYVHSAHGFVALVSQLPGDKAVVRKLADMERELTGTKYHVKMDLHTHNLDRDPGDIGIEIVGMTELIPFNNLDQLGMKSSELYAVYNIPPVVDDVTYINALARGTAKGLDEFVYIVRDMPLSPKLNYTKWVPLRNQQGDLVFTSQNGIKQPVMVHPQDVRKMKMFDEKVGTEVIRNIPLWSTPMVLVLGEQTGKLNLIPASWLYKITPEIQDNTWTFEELSFDKSSKKMMKKTTTYQEVPTVRAWEDRAVVDHHLFTLKRIAKGLGKPEPGSFSILPAPAPHVSYRDPYLPVRDKYINVTRYKWENPNGKKTVVITDEAYGYNMDESAYDIEWQMRAHDAGANAENASIGCAVVIEMPGTDEIKANCNMNAWYWQMPSATAAQVGLSNMALNWTTSINSDIIATVTCNNPAQGINYALNIKVIEAGVIGIANEVALTKAQEAFILRFVSYKNAEHRVLNATLPQAQG